MSGHTAARNGGYARRRLEDTVFLTKPSLGTEERGGLPSFVRDDFEAYLQCGRLECGFLEPECRQCGHSQLVALSCKKGLAPQLLGAQGT